MANTRDIRRRIKSVKNTSQITRAMQLVAASKMKKAQDSALLGRPYAELLFEMLSSLGDHLVDFRHPLLENRSVAHRGIILISSDRGLCGPLNSNLFRLLGDIDRETRFVCLGRKATQFLTRTGRNLVAEFTMSDNVGFNEVRPAVELMIKSYMEEEVDTIEVLYSRFINTLVQEATLLPLLPLSSLTEVLARQAELSEREVIEDPREIQFEPGPEEILADLLNLFLKQEIYHKVLEAKASEHSARMVAMKTATDNANNLIDDLTLAYNKVRQASITQEILEISAATLSSSA